MRFRFDFGELPSNVYFCDRLWLFMSCMELVKSLKCIKTSCPTPPTRLRKCWPTMNLTACVATSVQMLITSPVDRFDNTQPQTLGHLDSSPISANNTRSQIASESNLLNFHYLKKSIMNIFCINDKFLKLRTRLSCEL